MTSICACKLNFKRHLLVPEPRYCMIEFDWSGIYPVLFVHSASFERMCERIQSTWSFRSFATCDFIKKSTYLYINWSAKSFNRKCVKFGGISTNFQRFPSENDDFHLWNQHILLKQRALLSPKPGRFPGITWVGCCQWFRWGEYQRWTLPVGAGQVGY